MCDRVTPWRKASKAACGPTQLASCVRTSKAPTRRESGMSDAAIDARLKGLQASTPAQPEPELADDEDLHIDSASFRVRCAMICCRPRRTPAFIADPFRVQ